MRLSSALTRLLFATTCHSFPTTHTPKKLSFTPVFTSSKPLPDYGNTPIEVDTIRLSKIKKYRRKDLDGQTLVTQTLTELETDTTFQETSNLLSTIGPKQMSRDERARRRRALDELGVPPFYKKASGVVKRPIRRQSPTVLQLNIGLYCNQACGHCHVESSPLRKEMMSAEIASRCLELLRDTPSITTLDITGGAPELNEQFRFLVSTARSLRPDITIIDRCNLTVLHEPSQSDLVDFLVENRVRVVASLPCYSPENVNEQRGNGVFDRSISALLMLNEAGYGGADGGYGLDLVYNPLGAFLPPEQKKLEAKYKEVLMAEFGIVFNNLFTITNMPVKRFADFLYRRGELKEYMDLLVRNFNEDTVESLMCLETVSVGWDGKVYDCDFNQQLGYGIGSKEAFDEHGKTVFDIASLDDLAKDRIYFDNHCFGCTAGMGSS